MTKSRPAAAAAAATSAGVPLPSERVVCTWTAPDQSGVSGFPGTATGPAGTSRRLAASSSSAQTTQARTRRARDIVREFYAHDGCVPPADADPPARRPHESLDIGHHLLGIMSHGPRR